jgi:ABC-type sugar transport system substrate-binding protein
MNTKSFKLLKFGAATSLTALLGIVPLTAGTAGAQQKPVYGVLLKTLSNPYWGSVAKGPGCDDERESSAGR